MRALILFYSTYGHIYHMAEAVAEGVRKVSNCDVEIKRVPETLPIEVLEKMQAVDAQKKFSHVPICTIDEMKDYDCIFFGTPTRYGNMCGQMRQFLDATGKLWAQNSLVGKVGSVFASTGSQHGGQEATLLSFYVNLFHFGMVLAGLPYTFKEQSRMDEITGGSPYGATTIAGIKGDRMPSENELNAARFQGQHVASIAKKLVS
ncbi:MAG: NAD(P)H:quinone oxidoreductase [Parachlamydiales bacterium]|nr:NAD(P)H:quinone oxidoreductase [Parachlamydiales bacterium]